MQRILTVAVLALLSIGASAQQFPAKPITLVVPFTAASDADLAARNLAEGGVEFRFSLPLDAETPPP